MTAKEAVAISFLSGDYTEITMVRATKGLGEVSRPLRK